jgi:hypothetical protein
MKATHIPYLVILASFSIPGIARQPQPQQVQTQPAATQAPASACAAETDPDAQIVCLNKEHAYLLKLQQIKKMQQDNDALANAPAKPDVPAKPEVPQDKSAKKRKDCLMPGEKQKMLPEIVHGFYDAQRTKIIKDSKGQITPPTWAELHMPIPPCPVDPAIPTTAK